MRKETETENFTRDLTIEEFAERFERQYAGLEALPRTKTEHIKRDAGSDFEDAGMQRPLTLERSFSLLGAMLGLLGPGSLLARILINASSFNSQDGLFLLLSILAIAATSAAGYFSGKYVARFYRYLRKKPTAVLLLGVPAAGLAWGLWSGAIGGLFLMIVGALPGAVIGAVFGAAAMILFTPLHFLVSKGEKIEMKHFVPISFGVVAALSALIFSVE